MSLAACTWPHHAAVDPHLYSLMLAGRLPYPCPTPSPFNYYHPAAGLPTVPSAAAAATPADAYGSYALQLRNRAELFRTLPYHHPYMRLPGTPTPTSPVDLLARTGSSLLPSGVLSSPPSAASVPCGCQYGSQSGSPLSPHHHHHHPAVVSSSLSSVVHGRDALHTATSHASPTAVAALTAAFPHPPISINSAAI